MINHNQIIIKSFLSLRLRQDAPLRQPCLGHRPLLPRNTGHRQHGRSQRLLQIRSRRLLCADARGVSQHHGQAHGGHVHAGMLRAVSRCKLYQRVRPPGGQEGDSDMRQRPHEAAGRGGLVHRRRGATVGALGVRPRRGVSLVHHQGEHLALLHSNPNPNP